MKKVIKIFVTGLLILAACWPVAATPTSTKIITTSTKPMTNGSDNAWQEKWQTILALAKKEGALAIYASWGPQVRVALAKVFWEKFAIKIEFTPGRAENLVQRVQTEKSAGLNIVDVLGLGVPGLLLVVEPKGLLGPLKPLILLPEVLEPKVWTGEKIPFVDREAILAVAMIGSTSRTLAYNTSFIKEGEIKSAKDLLKPQYKGKISMKDPSVTGSANAFLSHVSLNLWGEAETINFLRRLVNEQKVVIQRDDRIHVESVARGKYYIAIGPQQEITARLLAAGAPIKVPVLEMDNRLSAGTGALGVPTTFAHPNAAIVFVNWILTKEGQSIFAKAFGSPSMRIDASNEGIDPAFIPIAGKKYYPVSYEFLKTQRKWIGIATKIIEEAKK